MKNLMAVGGDGGQKISFSRFDVKVPLFNFIRKISFHGYKTDPP